MLIFILFFIFILSTRHDLLAQTIQSNLPHQQEIEENLNNLGYSGFSLFSKPQTKINLDFQNHQWEIRNSRTFDIQGNLLLDQNRYGLCVDLSIYLHSKIKSLLQEGEELRFARTVHAGFFPGENSNHIVLILFNKIFKKTFLIDPSFHVYGEAQDLKEYEILDIKDHLLIEQNQLINDVYLVDTGIPLFIRQNVLLSFSVLSIDKLFNRDNFLFTISCKPKNADFGIDLMMVGRFHGEYIFFINKNLLKKFISEEELQLILSKLDECIKNLSS